MRGRASRPVCREAWSPHHIGAVVQGRLALDHMGLCSFWNQEPRRGACGPKQDQPVSTFQETASPVLLSLQLTVLTSGTPGSLHSQAPRLSGPLSLGPEEVARVAGMRTSSGAWLEQEQGLWSVLSPSRDQGCGDGDRPTSRRFRPSATSWPGQGRGLGSPAALRGKRSPPSRAQTLESHRGPKPTAAQVSRSPKPCPRALNPLPNVCTPPGWGGDGGSSTEAPGEFSGPSPWGWVRAEDWWLSPEAAAPSVRPSPRPGPFPHPPQLVLDPPPDFAVRLLLGSRRCHPPQQQGSSPACPHRLLSRCFHTGSL